MSKSNLDDIRHLLTEGLSPLDLQIEDESALHAGHAGAAARWDGGVTHLKVRVVSSAFAGKSRVDRHRLVNALLTSEMAKGLHALAIEAKAPGE